MNIAAGGIALSMADARTGAPRIGTPIDKPRTHVTARQKKSGYGDL